MFCLKNKQRYHPLTQSVRAFEEHLQISTLLLAKSLEASVSSFVKGGEEYLMGLF